MAAKFEDGQSQKLFCWTVTTYITLTLPIGLINCNLFQGNILILWSMQRAVDVILAFI